MKKLLQRFGKIEELVIGYALLFIALVATAQVFQRYILGTAYDWVDEGSRYMIVLITFAGAGVCVKYSAHFCMDALVQYVPTRIKHLLKAVSNTVSMVVISVVFYYSWVLISRLHQFEVTTPAFRMPMTIPYLPIGIFSAVIALRFLAEAVKHAHAFARNLPYGNKGAR
jgi:TRAP-type C4-dicarboxylate transport system permease small subunit